MPGFDQTVLDEPLLRPIADADADADAAVDAFNQAFTVAFKATIPDPDPDPDADAATVAAAVDAAVAAAHAFANAFKVAFTPAPAPAGAAADLFSQAWAAAAVGAGTAAGIAAGTAAFNDSGVGDAAHAATAAAATAAANFGTAAGTAAHAATAAAATAAANFGTAAGTAAAADADNDDDKCFDARDYVACLVIMCFVVYLDVAACNQYIFKPQLHEDVIRPQPLDVFAPSAIFLTLLVEIMRACYNNLKETKNSLIVRASCTFAAMYIECEGNEPLNKIFAAAGTLGLFANAYQFWQQKATVSSGQPGNTEHGVSLV